MICIKCGIKLTKENSYKTPNRQCKSCFKIYTRTRPNYRKNYMNYYRLNKEQILENQKMRESTYRYTAKGKQSRKEASKRAYQKFPEKWNARAKLNYAVKIGYIIKPDICEINDDCNGRIEAHHHRGYANDMWAEVQWLCVKHHSELHYKIEHRKFEAVIREV